LSSFSAAFSATLRELLRVPAQHAGKMLTHRFLLNSFGPRPLKRNISEFMSDNSETKLN
jgi:hypothetical protein